MFKKYWQGRNKQVEIMEEYPHVFISYSWEDEEHKKWVKEFTDRLIDDGVDADLDQYDLQLGDRLPQFMEKEISQADYVLIICTPTYKKKADGRVGGVGYEGHIISGELFSKSDERKFIPVLRKGDFSSSIPTFLNSKLGIDLRDENAGRDEDYKNLIATLFNQNNKKPKRGVPKGIVYSRQTFVNKTEENNKNEDSEDIHILGIVTDEVTIPRMDGTRGSALYAIPFKLSKQPSSLWKEIFIQTWNSPPKFTLMHRPGIASVVGDEIILNGTTIEEVKKYHRDTLVLCVDVANKKEQEIIERQKKEKEEKEKRIRKHYQEVEDVSKSIKF